MKMLRKQISRTSLDLLLVNCLIMLGTRSKITIAAINIKLSFEVMPKHMIINMLYRLDLFFRIIYLKNSIDNIADKINTGKSEDVPG